MLWLISGPTSVGKSTFIASPRCAEITGFPPRTPVAWPATYSSLKEQAATDLFYHYNTLRPLHLKHRHETSDLPENHPVVRSAIDFNHDPRWREVVEHRTDKKAVVLVANKQILLQRARQRQIIENQELTNQEESSYPARLWLNLLEQVDLVALYQAWCRELRSYGIPYVLVNSNDDAYSIIESDEQLPAVVNGVDPEPRYTKGQIKKILRERNFRYHRVNLPYGLHTKGADRSATRDLVLPKILAGKTVLDVGSALGYFCFEAEARGAQRVVGVELSEDRFVDALLLKDIKGSNVEFLRRDIIAEPLEEHFDHILLLNVIHHLYEPFGVIRQLASRTRERLVIEFPTFADRKFKKTTRGAFALLYNRLPLIGVSSQSQADQTFVFAPPAIKKALLDHEPLFERVDILRSPMPGRAIAICYKKPKRD